MAVKGFFASKLNWLGLIMSAIGILELLDGAKLENLHGWITFATGALTVVLRTFFTATRALLRS